MGKRIDLKGKKFGRLKVLNINPNHQERGVGWNCICDCGNKCIAYTSGLNSGQRLSCGCLFKERMEKNPPGFKEGSKNPSWKGDNVGLPGVHDWIRDRKEKPEFCERCGKEPPRDLANISGKYLRDVNDFEYLCRKCHMRGDGRSEKARKFQQGRTSPDGICPQCGITFSRKYHSSKMKFCSSKCFNSSRRGISRPFYGNQWTR